jgi:hypothetical protein
MQVFVPVERVSLHNVFFVDKKKNVVIDGNFIKILYSNAYMELNGLYVSFQPFAQLATNGNVAATEYISRRAGIVSTSAKSSTKYAIEFAPYHFENIEVINKLCHLERAIVEQYVSMHAPNKIAIFNLRTQLMTGSIKVQSANEPPFTSAGGAATSPQEPPKKYALKISGVWETTTNVGITVKFVTVGDCGLDDFSNFAMKS